MFPFKFELKDALVDYHNSLNPNSMNNNETMRIIQNELLSFYLMFLEYNNRTSVLEFVEKINKKYYNVKIPDEYDEYLKHIPKVIHTMDQYDDAEFKLIEMLGFKVNREYHTAQIIKSVIQFIIKKFPQYKVK